MSLSDLYKLTLIVIFDELETDTMDPGTQEATHCSGLTGDAMKLAELLVKLKFIEESAKSVVVNGLDSGEELEDLADYMCKIFVQNCRKPSSDQKEVVVSTMTDIFLKILVWRLQHMTHVSGTINIF